MYPSQTYHKINTIFLIKVYWAILKWWRKLGIEPATFQLRSSGIGTTIEIAVYTCILRVYYDLYGHYPSLPGLRAILLQRLCFNRKRWFIHCYLSRFSPNVARLKLRHGCQMAASSIKFYKPAIERMDSFRPKWLLLSKLAPEGKEPILRGMRRQMACLGWRCACTPSVNRFGNWVNIFCLLVHFRECSWGP